jgi:hypothetical protein
MMFMKTIHVHIHICLHPFITYDFMYFQRECLVLIAPFAWLHSPRLYINARKQTNTPNGVI